MCKEFLYQNVFVFLLREINLVGSLCVSDLSTPALQLFHYLLSHAKDYEMEVKRMVFNEKIETESSSPQVFLGMLIDFNEQLFIVRLFSHQF